MDSDSSLDGEFESKHEVAAKFRVSTPEDHIQNGSEEGSDDSGSEEGDLNVSKSPPRSENCEMSPKSSESSRLASTSEVEKTDLSPKSVGSVSVKSPRGDTGDQYSKSPESTPIQSPVGIDRGEMSPQSPRSSNFESLPPPDNNQLSPRSAVSSTIASPPQADRGNMSPRSDDDGELSESSHSGRESRQSNASVSSANSKVPTQNDVDDEKGEEKDTAVCDEQVEEKEDHKPEEIVKKDGITGHGEDLSDVSDLDSNDGNDSLDAISEEDRKRRQTEEKKREDAKARKDAAAVEEMEQLDFEAEEQQEKEEKEEGECEDKKDDKSDDEGELKGDDLEEGELTDEDENRPEETEPRPVCRFYNRGQCTWGSSCRFLHPGVTDKGNYTMFDMVRPLVPMNGPPMYPPMDYRPPYERMPMAAPYPGPRKDEPPVFESAWERGLRQAKEMMRKSTKRKETDMDFEEKKMNLSLGQEELDKENDYYTRPASPILRDDSERWSGRHHGRESSFEDVPESPYYREYWRRVHYEAGGESRGLRVEAEYGGRSSKYHQRSSGADYYDKYEKYDKKSSRQKAAPAREVIVERADKPWRDDSHRGRGDEWADPWMRSKSPTGRKTSSKWPSRRPSYSSASSYSSSSSSHSSSQSSYSSYSRDSHSRSRSKSPSPSRSRSRSSSRTPLSRARRKVNRPLVPTARTATAVASLGADGAASPPASPRKTKLAVAEARPLTKTAKPLTSTLIQSEKKAASERALLMNPPAPSPRKPQKEVRPPSPGMRSKSAQNPPAPVQSAAAARIPAVSKLAMDRSKIVLAAAMSNKDKQRSRSRSSRSSSGSDSSGSSSDSSGSSYSSSSSSREPSPKAVRPPKRIVMDERERLALTQSLKVKAMDALKLSGQKQQIKLTLKTPGANPAAPAKRTVTGLPELPELNLVRRDRMPAMIAGRKRPSDSPLSAESVIAAKVAALSKQGSSKKATSRREELLKQLKAVEDAIARKRSKI